MDKPFRSRKCIRCLSCNKLICRTHWCVGEECSFNKHQRLMKKSDPTRCNSCNIHLSCRYKDVCGCNETIVVSQADAEKINYNYICKTHDWKNRYEQMMKNYPYFFENSWQPVTVQIPEVSPSAQYDFMMKTAATLIQTAQLIKPQDTNLFEKRDMWFNLFGPSIWK